MVGNFHHMFIMGMSVGVNRLKVGPHDTYCLHVGPTNLLEDAHVGGSVGQVGAHQM